MCHTLLRALGENRESVEEPEVEFELALQLEPEEEEVEDEDQSDTPESSSRDQHSFPSLSLEGSLSLPLSGSYLRLAPR